MIEDSKKLKILTSAKKLFIEHGFAGTSIMKIAKLAQVNSSLIFHYYVNKENLWREVKQSIALDQNNKSKTLPNIQQPFTIFLKELIYNCIDFYINNSEIVRIINWQRLELNNDSNIGITLSTDTHAWLEAFKHYQNLGQLKANLKVEFIITLVLSIVSSAALDKNIFISKQEDKTEYIDFCVNVLLKSFS